jgi:hypothetical protein
MQVDSGGHKAGCFFVNFVILKIWQIFPKKIPELFKFTLEKTRVSKIFQFFFLERATKFVGKEKNW